MKRILLAIVGILCVITIVGCSVEPEKDVMEEIYNSVAVKLEWAEDDTEPCILTSEILLFKSICDWNISPTDSIMNEDWIYRFTFNPSEICKGTEEIVVEFGQTKISIDGIIYETDDPSAYESALEWAKEKYDYYVPSK